MVRSLEGARFACEQAMDAEEALYWAAGTPFDLVIVDLVSWGKTGPDLLARLRNMTRARGTAILVLGGESPAGTVALDADVVLVGAVDPERLVREALQL